MIKRGSVVGKRGGKGYSAVTRTSCVHQDEADDETLRKVGWVLGDHGFQSFVALGGRCDALALLHTRGTFATFL